jgi:hypothetical protein
MSELNSAARDFGRLESDVSTLKRDVGEVKSGLHELRRDQQNMMQDHAGFGVTLARIESKLEGRPKAALAKYDMPARWLTRGLVILFILGMSGAITLNFDKINTLLRLTESVSVVTKK